GDFTFSISLASSTPSAPTYGFTRTFPVNERRHSDCLITATSRCCHSFFRWSPLNGCSRGYLPILLNVSCAGAWTCWPYSGCGAAKYSSACQACMYTRRVTPNGAMARELYCIVAADTSCPNATFWPIFLQPSRSHHSSCDASFRDTP